MTVAEPLPTGSPPVSLTVVQPQGRPTALQGRSRVNRWVQNATPACYRQMVDRPVTCTHWAQAVEQIEKNPLRHVLVLLDPGEHEIRRIRLQLANHPVDTIVWRAGASCPYPLSSEASPVHWVVDRHLEAALRKRVLAHARGGWVEIRPLRETTDLRRYLALRYDVWRQMGYLAPDRDFPEVGWEVDPSDRRSLAFGAFDHDGDLVGCVRLVLDRVVLGAEARMGALLDETDHPGIRSCLQVRRGPAQPYDVLESFECFRRRYREWRRKGLRSAEVSRVIVHPRARRRGLAEALVDTALRAAWREGVHIAFLACVESHEPLYAVSGFERMPDMECESFAAVRVPAIGMWRKLEERRD